MYRAAGDYTIVARVSDSAGKVTTMRRSIVVQDASGNVAAGSGRLMSPAGANRLLPHHAGPASFSFIGPAAQGAAGTLQFATAGLAFRGTGMRVLPAAQGMRRLTGEGLLNGKRGYQVRLTVSAGSGGAADRLGLRIWHSDPVSKAVIVDYDNEAAGGGRQGVQLTEGAIAAAP
ncbi:hypothetical protein [Massilia sp. DWR3-1-1]|uniref:hypothetical protein n=1 Tax=Massilia sp. DWR3-1-1 TaxID=2804559 RepID=UPI003CFB98E9